MRANAHDLKKLLSQVGIYVLFNAAQHVVGFSRNEGAAGDVFVEFDVTVGNALYHFGSHFGNLLIVGTVYFETIVDEPFAYKLLRKLLLGFAFFKAFLIAFGIEIAR